MKRMKTIVFGLLAGCMLLPLAACGSAASSSAAASAAPSASFQAGPGGTLVMATNAEFPPYEYYEGGKIVGIDAEIAQKIADKLGMKLSIEDMAFDSIVAAVQTGKANIGMAGMSVTDDRKANVDFTDSYATTKQVIIVTGDSKITNKDGLKDKAIGVQQSTTGDICVTDDFGDSAVQRFNKGADAVQALKQGKVDAVVIDNEPAKVFVQQNKGLKILSSEYKIEEYAIVVKKGNTQLRDQVNNALKELIADGTVKSIIGKYIKA
ncbi:MAG: transporter substrate-binding domain-containing protein [Oscillospiraceae bacterium]|nr:transporter substrate-binding domain-containing protein [Oscillospiraceae bacterium]